MSHLALPLTLLACVVDSSEIALDVTATLSDETRAAVETWPVAAVATIHVEADPGPPFDLSWHTLGVWCDPDDDRPLVGRVASEWGSCGGGEAWVHVELAEVVAGDCDDPLEAIEWSRPREPLGAADGEPIPLGPYCTRVHGEEVVEL